jgi:hypothetical protein
MMKRHYRTLVQRVHSCIVGEPECGHMQARAVIREIADAVEQRGAKGEDLDPGETADWLRSEAGPTFSQEGYEA